MDYFDGIDGQPGKDGVDGQDGYTPVKGVDYFDGEDGADGSPGADGISCTHEWSGTTLTITSASGTSSADLKGEPGSDGQPGSDGSPGADGYTPVKGTDYWTDADKAEIVDEFKQLTGIGTMYKGAWIAEETTGIGQRYTDYITIPPGTYIVSVVLPYASVGYGNKICIGFSASMAIGTGNTFLDAAYGCATMLATFTVTTNLCVISAASSNSATWGYLERGGIAAVRVG